LPDVFPVRMMLPFMLVMAKGLWVQLVGQK